MNKPEPFSLAVSDASIADLSSRLNNTRFPDEIEDSGWSYGTEKKSLISLLEYWQKDFSWREFEDRFNLFDQFTLDIDDLQTHFIHQRSNHDCATPILITHGWPGSILEFINVIDRLTQPEKFGGDASDAFHVICPSLPGFGWSAPASSPGMNAEAIAKRHAKLMNVLGYDKYIAQGGDWGAIITKQIALVDPDHCIAIHLNMVPVGPPSDSENPMQGVEEAEMLGLNRSEFIQATGMGYYHIQSTRPQTLGYGLADSPAGLMAWIVEKFFEWSDCQGELSNGVNIDLLVANVAWYWYSNSITSSARLYFEESHKNSPSRFVETPTGVAVYPLEIVQSPKVWAEKEYNIVYWSRQDKGGHFAAMEQPEIFTLDIRSFKKELASLKII